MSLSPHRPCSFLPRRTCRCHPPLPIAASLSRYEFFHPYLSSPLLSSPPDSPSPLARGAHPRPPACALSSVAFLLRLNPLNLSRKQIFVRFPTARAPIPRCIALQLHLPETSPPLTALIPQRSSIASLGPGDMGEKTQASAPTSTAPPVAASGRPEEQEEKVAGEKPMLSSTEPLSGGLTHRNKSQTAKRIPFLRMEEAKGLAFFSTAHGAHSKREVPDPPPPVIVRIDRPQEVADFAHVYYNKYDRLYKCFFPFCGWAVEDLFDDYDIHLHGRTFLEKVLKYVTWENDYGVRIFAGAWARSYPDRLPFVKSCPYDPDDSLGIVFEVFTGGETHQFPPTFLWNAIAIMRNDLQSRPEAPSVVRETAAMTASSANGGPESRTATSTAQKVDNMDERRRPDDTTGSPAPIEIHIPPPQNHPVAQMPLARGSSNPMTDAPTQLQTPILAHPTVVPPTYAGGQAQGAQAGSLRNPRVRTQRQSSSHHRSGPYPGWAENMPMPPPTGQNRNASISMTMIPSPGPHSVVPVGPPISGGMGQMAPQMGNLPVFPPNVPGGMYPGHMPLGPIPQGPTQYPGLPLGGPNMDLSQQGYQVSLTGPRGMPISEFASNAPYGHVPTMQRHDQPGGSDPRRSGRPERQHALYNPYGAERPEFANIPSQSSNRRASRGGYPTGTVRFRKQSLGAYSRPTVLAGGEQHSMRGGHAEPFSPTNFGLPRDIQPIDPDDPERGCRDDWIGPKNDFVTELIVFDIPHEATDIDVMTFFQKRADVTPTNVKLRTDRYEHPIANVRYVSREPISISSLTKSVSRG
ncbi:hypothetical protein M011DRAFT_121151 [Sporormia fimetaria CBS 119925]|uniref:RRM domain-containing protein n=1 Tax=Sporormia fimetaria CBS 119925 TaxID=1340428 RepID=A0A6A6V9F6_9PLEO|nr:hypothetical protein M011DRAFT_121151 [Sporormia fimetaria CBS 119925]